MDGATKPAAGRPPCCIDSARFAAECSSLGGNLQKKGGYQIHFVNKMILNSK